MTKTFQKIAESSLFQNFIIAIIFLSILLMELETFWQEYAILLRVLEKVILLIFTIEIGIRIAAYGRKPWCYFQNGWNVFDFSIVALCFLPETQFVAVLRFVRILRVMRLLTVMQRAEIQRLKNIELTKAYQELAAEKAKSERLLLNILPLLVAQRLKEGAKTIADSYTEATVMFADIVGFTQLSSQITPQELVRILDNIFSRFDQLAEKYNLEKIKTIGDAYMIVSGVPRPRPDHVEVMANMALEMLITVHEFNQTEKRNLNIRIGIHTGDLIAGVIGQKKFIYDLWGDTVNTASRMESHGIPGKIQVTEAIYQTLQNSHEFETRGKIQIKGKNAMPTYFLLGKKN